MFTNPYSPRSHYDELHAIKTAARSMQYGARARLSWRQTAINLAFDIADYRSEDPYTQVGACAIKKEGYEVILGYNGPVPGFELNWKNREEKNEEVLHAEENVLTRIFPGQVEILALTHLPCIRCFRIIAQKKINIVIYSIMHSGYSPEKVLKMADRYKIEMIRMYPTTKNVPTDIQYNK